MASLNKVFLLGNLTRMPELRYTPNGAAVCEFGLAVNRKYQSNGQDRDETCFVDIVVWGKQAESCQRFLEKGSQAMIEGRLQFDQWDDRETGKKRSKLRVVADRVQFVGSRREGAGDYQGQQNGAYQSQPQQNGYQNNGYQSAPQQQGGYQNQQHQNGNGYQKPQQQNNAYQPPQQGGGAPQGNGFPAMPNDAFSVNDDAEDDIPF